MQALWFLSSRLFRSLKSLPALGFMYATSFFGIAVSIISLTIAFALSTGFQQAYQEALLHFNAHVLIFSGRAQQIETELNSLRENKLSDLKTVSPFVSKEGMLIAAGKIQGIVIKGERFENGKVPRLKTQIFSGEKHTSLPHVYLGNMLASQLAVQPQVQKLTVMLPSATQGSSWLPRAQEVELVGTFQSGLTEYDQQFVLTDFDNMEKFFGVQPETETALELTFADPWKALQELPFLREQFAEANILGWDEIDPDLMRAIKLEKTVVTLIVSIMVLAASLNLASTLLLLTVLRRRAMAIVMILGAPLKTVKLSLWAWGISLGSFAIFSGLLLGKLIVFLIQHFQLLPLDPEVYFLQAVPLDISWQTCGIIGFFSFLLMTCVLFFAVRKSLQHESLQGLLEVH